MKKMLPLLLITVFVMPLYAKTPNYSAQYTACIDKAGGVTLNMMDCNTTEIKTQDDQLNANYKKLMAAGDAGYKQALKKAQLLWIPYRDGNCQLHAQYAAGGSLAGILYGNCILEMTHARAKELQELLTEATENK